MNSERVAGFMSEWVAGIIGIRTSRLQPRLGGARMAVLAAPLAADDLPGP